MENTLNLKRKFYTGFVVKNIINYDHFSAVLDNLSESDSLVLFADSWFVEKIHNEEEFRFLYEYSCEYFNQNESKLIPATIIEIDGNGTREYMRELLGGVGETPIWVKVKNKELKMVFPGNPFPEKELGKVVAEYLEFDLSKLDA